jgi:hypothetical protein
LSALPQTQVWSQLRKIKPPLRKWLQLSLLIMNK